MTEGSDVRALSPRVLIVDDEPMIGLLLEELLTTAGYQIAGLATKLEPALEMINRGVCDVAILDANLAGVSSEPAALALTRIGAPFVVLSGYSKDQRKPGFAGGIHLQKPCKSNELIDALNTLADRGKPAGP